MRENFKENIKPFIFIIVVLILTALTAHSQRRYLGTVTEVVDGKTCVIQMPNGRLTVVLQYVETPEPAQALYQTVKDHFQKMVLQKQVEFIPRIMMTDKYVGQLTVGGVDVSQQMLRDGAAWYAVPEKSGQDADQRVVYQDNETRARNEKRGVWGVENLKPSWEFRLEQAALEKKQQEEAVRRAAFLSEMQNQSKQARRQSPASQPEGIWANVGGAYGFEKPLGIGGLLAGYNPNVRIGHISTPSILFDFPKTAFLQRVESRLYYLYKGDKANVEDSTYAVAFVTTASDYKFIKSNNLTIIAGGEKISFGKALRFWRENYTNKQELLVYEVSRAQMKKIARADKITIQIGGYSGVIAKESLEFVNNLLTAS